MGLYTEAMFIFFCYKNITVEALSRLAQRWIVFSGKFR